MTELLKKWNKAARKFETSAFVTLRTRGLNKRSSPIIDKFTKEGEAIAKILKVLDDMLVGQVGVAIGSNISNWASKYIDSLDEEVSKLEIEFRKELDKEKSELGKDAVGSLFRDLKIFRAELDAINSEAKHALAMGKAAEDVEIKKIEFGIRDFHQSCKQCAAGIAANAKTAIAANYQVAKDPTAANFNRLLGNDALHRNITQHLANLAKITNVVSVEDCRMEKHKRYLENPHVKQLSEELKKKIAGFEKKIEALVEATGSDPINASLGRKANGAIRFPPNATPDQVKLALKVHLAQMRECELIARLAS